MLLRTQRLARYIAYEDAIYRAMPSWLHAALAGLEAERLRANAISARAFRARQIAAIKRRALRAYPSQIRAFGQFPEDIERSEHTIGGACAPALVDDLTPASCHERRAGRLPDCIARGMLGSGHRPCARSY